MEKVFYHLAKDLRSQEKMESVFPHLASSDSIKERIKKEFGFADFSSVSTLTLAEKLAAHPEKIRDICTHTSKELA